MEDQKVRPWEDYDYRSKLPDFWEVTGIALGLGICKGYQVSTVRPVNKASVGLMAAFVAGGYMVGKVVTKIRDDSFRRRQLFLEDYVDKHPEDFLSQEPKKYKDVLWEWTPHR